MRRSGIERLLQAVVFEIGGLLVAVPLYQAYFGRSPTQSVILLATLSVAVLCWIPVHNRLFDTLEHRFARSAVTPRTHGCRIVHALSHELTPIVVTMPLIMFIGGHTLREALTLNFGLTFVYVVYAYVFYLTYDALAPPPGPRKHDPSRQELTPTAQGGMVRPDHAGESLTWPKTGSRPWPMTTTRAPLAAPCSTTPPPVRSAG